MLEDYQLYISALGKSSALLSFVDIFQVFKIVMNRGHLVERFLKHDYP